jgi:predicted lipid carrier protein YhbT
MWVYPLQSVLAWRQREEDAAATLLAEATKRRLKAEEREAQLAAAVESARQRLQCAQDAMGKGDLWRASGHSLAVIGGVAAAAASLFLERRRGELTQAREALAHLRRVELAEARTSELAARQHHLSARRIREAFERHAGRQRAAAHASASRREEESLEDVARAARHARHD